MSDQTYNNIIAVEDQATPALQQYAEQWQAVAAAQDQAAESASAVSEASTSSEEALMSQAEATNSASTAASEHASAMREEAEAEEEEAKAAEEAAEAKMQMAEASRAAIEGNTQEMASMAGLGAAAIVLGVAYEKIKEVVTEYTEAGAEAEKATASMDATFKANTENSKEQIEAVEGAAGGFAKYGITVTQVEDIMSKMTPAIHDANTELRAVQDAADLAAAAHISVEQASTLLTRAMESGGGALHRYGVYIDSTARGVDVLSAVEKKFGGVADQVAATGAGAMDRLTAAQKNLNETVGVDFINATAGFHNAETQLIEGLDAAAQHGNHAVDVLTSLNDLLFGLPFKISAVEVALKNWATGYDPAIAAQQAFQQEADATVRQNQTDWVQMSSDTTTNADNITKAWGELSGRAVPEAMAKMVSARQTDMDQGARYAQANQNISNDITTNSRTTTEQVVSDLEKEFSANQSLLDAISNNPQQFGSNWQAVQETVEQHNASIIDSLGLLGQKFGDTATDTGHAMDDIKGFMDIADQAAADATTTGDVYKKNLDVALVNTESMVKRHVLNIHAILQQAWADIKAVNDAAADAAGKEWTLPVTYNLHPGQTPYEVEQATVGIGPGGKGWESDVSPADLQPGGLYGPDKPTKAKGGGGGGSKSKASGPTPEDLEAQAKQLQLTKDNTEAQQAEAAATAAVTAADKQFQSALQGVSDAQQKNTEAEAADTQLNNAKANASVTQQEAGQQAAEDAKDANNLAISIHQVSDRLKELGREAAIDMAPLKTKLDEDTEAMNALDAATAKTDHTYTDTLNNISNQQYDETQAATADMKPYLDSLDAANTKLGASQAAVQALGEAEANKLFPIDKQLTDLQNQQAADQRAKQLDAQAQSVANLTAEMANLIPGSAQYNALQKQRDEVEKSLGQNQQVDKLTKEKNAIQDKYSSEIEAATKQEQAAAAQQKAAQAAAATEQKVWDQRKAALDEEAQTTQHQQTLYDQQQADKKYNQQQTLDDDNAAINSANAVAAARAAADTAYLAELQDEQGEEAYNASQHSYNWGVAEQAANDAVTALEIPYNMQAAQLDTLSQKIKDQKTAYDESTQPILDDLAKIQGGTQATLDVFKNNQDAAKTSDAWAAAVKAGGEGFAAMHDTGPDVAADIDAINKSAAAATTVALSFASALKDPSSGIAGAFTGLTTVVDPALDGIRQTVNKYLGLAQDPGFDASVSLGWFMDHKNPQGLYGRMSESADLALGKDGLRGMFDNRFQDMETDVTGRAIQMGDQIMGGIASGVSSQTAVDGLAKALVAAVEAAMSEAESSLGIHSPSEVSRKRIGHPLGSGVAAGVMDAKPEVDASVRAITDQSYSGSGSVGGMAGGPGSTVMNVDQVSLQLYLPNVTNADELKQAMADPSWYTPGMAFTMMVVTDHEAEMRGLRRMATIGR